MDLSIIRTLYSMEFLDNTPILRLPPEVLLLILENLSNKDFGKTQVASRFFHLLSTKQLICRMRRDYLHCCGHYDPGFLSHASHRGWTIVGDYLLSEGEKIQDINLENGNPQMKGYDCLAVACSSGKFNMVNWLIEHGYQPTLCSIRNAIQTNNIVYLDIIASLPSCFNDRFNFITKVAIENGNIDTLRHVLKRMPQLILGHQNFKMMDFIAAVTSGNIKMIEFIENYFGKSFLDLLRDNVLEQKPYFDIVKYSYKILYNVPNLAMFKCLLARGFRVYEGIFQDLFSWGHMEILDYLFEENMIPLPARLDIISVRDFWRSTAGTGVDNKKTWLRVTFPGVPFYDYDNRTRITLDDLIEKIR